MYLLVMMITLSFIFDGALEITHINYATREVMLSDGSVITLGDLTDVHVGDELSMKVIMEKGLVQTEDEQLYEEGFYDAVSLLSQYGYDAASNSADPNGKGYAYDEGFKQALEEFKEGQLHREDD
jgi:hypothetical protein